jgi:energy-coupling factor transport system ATP-binding protein
MTLLSFERYGFRYRRAVNWALSDIDLAVGQGELLGIVGPSGAGKSTLAASIGAFIPSLIRGETDGKLVVDGRTTETSSPRDLAGIVGTVFQDFESQIFSSRVDVETAFGPENLGLKRNEIVSRVNRSLALVNLTEKKLRIPSDLSGGEKQRLVIASILAMEPKILVFDEPITDLDPEGQRDVLALLERLLTEKHRTAVLVDHESDHLASADRIAVLAGGKLVGIGTPREIFRDAKLRAKYRLKPLAHIEILSALGIVDAPLSVADTIPILRRLNRPFDRAKTERILKKERRRTAKYGAPLIEIDGLSFSYGKNRIISDLSLTIREREFVALVGPNGSGKTTLVKQMNGLLRPQRGKVLVSGRPPASYSVREISEVIGFVHQNPDRMIFAERVFDEAAFGLVVRNTARKIVEERVLKVLSVVGLGDKADEDPFLLTKGERQRLAVAATLAVGPQVLILDEPTTGLDYGEIIDMMNLLKSLNERGHTVICITHNMDVAARFCHRMIILESGSVIADGSAREVFSQQGVLDRGMIVPPPAVQLGIANGFVTLTAQEFIECIGDRREHE